MRRPRVQFTIRRIMVVVAVVGVVSAVVVYTMPIWPIAGAIAIGALVLMAYAAMLLAFPALVFLSFIGLVFLLEPLGTSRARTYADPLEPAGRREG
jgi:hypothetical protein